MRFSRIWVSPPVAGECGSVGKRFFFFFVFCIVFRFLFSLPLFWNDLLDFRSGPIRRRKNGFGARIVFHDDQLYPSSTKPLAHMRVCVCVCSYLCVFRLKSIRSCILYARCGASIIRIYLLRLWSEFETVQNGVYVFFPVSYFTSIMVIRRKYGFLSFLFESFTSDSFHHKTLSSL